MSGAGTYCAEECAKAGCEGFSSSSSNDDNNAVGTGIGNRQSF